MHHALDNAVQKILQLTDDNVETLNELDRIKLEFENTERGLQVEEERVDRLSSEKDDLHRQLDKVPTCRLSIGALIFSCMNAKTRSKDRFERKSRLQRPLPLQSEILNAVCLHTQDKITTRA
jgi:hypothetical protein